MIENSVCCSTIPITVQAGLRARKLALHSNRSYCYAFRSRAALTNTNPAPAPVILLALHSSRDFAADLTAWIFTNLSEAAGLVSTVFFLEFSVVRSLAFCEGSAVGDASNAATSGVMSTK